MKIQPIPGYARKSSVTASEAILYLLDKHSASLRAPELVELLTSRFVPPFAEWEIKEATAHMIDTAILDLTPDRKLVLHVDR